MTTPAEAIARTRVRVHGGRLVHAVEPYLETSYRTACRKYYGLARVNHWLPADATVTCRACVQRLAEGGQ